MNKIFIPILFSVLLLSFVSAHFVYAAPGDYIVSTASGDLIRITPTGSLTTITSGLGFSDGVAIDPITGDYIVAAGANLYRVDANSHVTTNIGSTFSGASGVAIDPITGDYIVADGSTGLIRVDRITEIGQNFATGLGFTRGLAIEPVSGNYTVTGGNTLWTVNAAGAKTVIASTGLGTPNGVAVESQGTYIVTHADFPFSILNVTSTSVSTIANSLGSFPNDVVIAPSGNYTVTVANPTNSLLTVNATTGLFSPIKQNIGDARGLAIEPPVLSHPTIKIIKNSTNVNDSFDFIITNATNAANSTSVSIPNSLINNMTATISVIPGIYNVTEIVPTGWTLHNSDCEKNGTSLGIENIFAAPGDSIECIFENIHNATSVMVPSANSTAGNIDLKTSEGYFTEVLALNATDFSHLANYNPTLNFPYGLVSWNVTGLVPGATISVEITQPGNIPMPAKYWKVNQTSWINATSIMNVINLNTLTLTITDGGLFDLDGQVNGKISDPGGVAFVESEELDKVEICHKGKNTITVSKNAVSAHIAHGDDLGMCEIEDKPMKEKKNK